jgi:putative NAD(P)-binding protein
MTRSPDKVPAIRAQGGEPVVCDVFEKDRLVDAVKSFQPDAVVDQLTDLPDRRHELGEHLAGNDRIRTEGTRNLVAAATTAGANHFVAQSIAWRPEKRGHVIDLHEQQVLEIGGVVVRYGRLYGPGTYYERELPSPPRVHVDTAARATPPLIDEASGIVTIADSA